MLELIREAADAAVLGFESWECQPGGDSLFAVLPEDVDDARVIADFVRKLDDGLSEYNARLKDSHRLRLRVTLVHGISVEGALGRPGSAPVAVSRLSDAPVVKQALAASQRANMVVAIDHRLYEDVVRQRLNGLRPEDWARVSIKVKSFRSTAYLSIPGHHPVPQTEPADPGDTGTVAESVQHARVTGNKNVVVQGNGNTVAGRDVVTHRPSGR
jgi:hypothetical protein